MMGFPQIFTMEKVVGNSQTSIHLKKWLHKGLQVEADVWNDFKKKNGKGLRKSSMFTLPKFSMEPENDGFQ